jgi:hypothetical protein
MLRRRYEVFYAVVTIVLAIAACLGMFWLLP